MIMAIVDTIEINDTNNDIVYCYSIDGTKAIVRYDNKINNSMLIDYNDLSSLLVTQEWKQPEDII